MCTPAMVGWVGGLQLSQECLDLFLTAEQVTGATEPLVGNKTLPAS